MTDVDLKSVAKPPMFGGEDTKLPEWSYTMRAHLGVTSDELVSCLETAESLSQPIQIAQNEPFETLNFEGSAVFERKNLLKYGDNSTGDTKRMLARACRT